MFLTLHVDDSPIPTARVFNDFIDRAAERYGTTKIGWQARVAQDLATDALQSLKNYRQRENGYGKSRFTTTFLLFRYNLMEIVYMAKRPSKPLATNTPGNLTFLNYRLTDEQLHDYDELKITPAQVLTALNTAVMDGFRLSFSYNPDKKLANAMLTDTREDSPTHLHALSAFSDDCADALKLLLYKHQVLLNGEWISLITDTPAQRKRG